MHFRSFIVPLIAFSICGPSLAYSQSDQLQIVRSMIQRELKKFDTLQDQWPGIEAKLKKASGRYKTAEKSIGKCKRGVWRSLFKDSLAGLESARAKLEDSRKQLEVARHKGLSALGAQQRAMLLLEAEYASEAKDITYYSKLNDIVTNISDNYYDVTNDVVYVGYQDYIAGIGELGGAYKAAAKDCNRPIPTKLFTSVVDAVFGKVDIVEVLAGNILDRIPDKYKVRS